MSKFRLNLDERSEAFLDTVSDIMSEIFEIKKEEAIEIINSRWEGLTIKGNHVFYHEEEDYWARFLYYPEDMLAVDWPK